MYKLTVECTQDKLQPTMSSSTQHTQPFIIQHLVVIGVGLIGGSLAQRLRQAGVVKQITGVGRGKGNLEKAVEMGVIDRWTHDISQAVSDADMVFISVPMGAYDHVFQCMAKSLAKDAVVTDAGSTKQHAIEGAKQYLPNPDYFVAAHPIAGTEHSGVEASFSSLFEGHDCIITPTTSNDAMAVKRVKQMWEATGSRVVCMPADEHDLLLASVSHLPHLTAYALVNAVRKTALNAQQPFQFAAGGFRDFTRIASSSPQMWRDISLSNRSALLQKMDAFIAEMQTMRQHIASTDAEKLLEAFQQAKDARDHWLTEHGENN